MMHRCVALPLILLLQLSTVWFPGRLCADEKKDDSPPHRKADGRLILLPTATPLGAGEALLSLHEIFFPSLAFGVTDRVSVEGGASLVPAAGARMFFLSSKFTPVRSGNVDVACGLWFLGKSGERGSGFGYTNLTYGDGGESMTIGVGWGLNRTGGTGGPFFNGGVSLQLSGETNILTELFIPPNLDPAIITLGTRWRAENLSVELAVILPWSPDGVQATVIPWTSFSIGL